MSKKMEGGNQKGEKRKIRRLDQGNLGKEKEDAATKNAVLDVQEGKGKGNKPRTRTTRENQ